MQVQEGMLSNAYGLNRSSVSLRLRRIRALNYHQVILLILITLSLLFPVQADAETISFCVSVPTQPTDWNSSVILPKFDPKLGDLTAVDLESKLNLSLGIMMENRNPKPANYSISIFGGYMVALPGSDNITQNINQSFDGELSGYDGTIDNSGPSGLNTSIAIQTEPAYKRCPVIDDFIAGPGENITLPVNISMNSLMRVSGNTNSELSLKAGAQLCISFTYDAKKSNEGDS